MIFTTNSTGFYREFNNLTLLAIILESSGSFVGNKLRIDF